MHAHHVGAVRRLSLPGCFLELPWVAQDVVTHLVAHAGHVRLTLGRQMRAMVTRKVRVHTRIRALPRLMEFVQIGHGFLLAEAQTVLTDVMAT
jgi:hypothetical protein